MTMLSILVDFYRRKMSNLFWIFFSNQRLSAIGLLCEEKQPFNDIKLSEKQTELKLNEKLVDIKKKKSRRYGCYTAAKIRATNANYLKLFMNISQIRNMLYASSQVIIKKRTFPYTDVHLKDLKFEGEIQLGKVYTPAWINDCTGPRFMLGHNVLNVMPPVLSVVSDDDFDDLNGASCTSSSIQLTELAQITTQKEYNKP